MIIIAVYVVVGAGAAVSVIHREPKRSIRPVLMFFLWPFLLPPALFREPLPIRANHRLAALREELRIALSRSTSDGREHRIVEAFVEQTMRDQQVMVELDAAIASSPARVRARLQDLRERSHQRIESAVGLLEEMLAQLTVLRFSELAAKNGEEEKRKIEDLMAKIEALASLASDEGLRRAGLP
jgi:hypothetical protein